MGDTAGSGVALSLVGRVALVTGGSRGIGAATVRMFRRAGAQVVFSYRAAEEQAKKLVAECGGEEACRAVKQELAALRSSLPADVAIEDDGVTRLRSNNFYSCPGKRRVIMLAGDGSPFDDQQGYGKGVADVFKKTPLSNDVSHVRNIVQGNGFGSEKRRCHTRQCRIFCAADGESAAQWSAARDAKLIHDEQRLNENNETRKGVRKTRGGTGEGATRRWGDGAMER